MLSRRLTVVVVLALAVPLSAQDAAEFFEKKIRPVLVNHCYGCHSAAAPKLQGGLLLDSREGLRKGGNSGAALTPGDPTSSLLIRAVRWSSDEIKMPPAGRLPDSDIAALEEWVRAGAPDPRSGASQTAASPELARARRHWAFQRPQAPAGCATIDCLHRAALREKSLTPNPPAGRRTLIRRVTYDLTGLPPAIADIESAESYEAIVDRLLASPAFGEKWARHWLDLARYADTKNAVERFGFSYTYRDWVIGAFNEDMPYDRFIQLQLAADQIPGARREDLAALGFVSLGRRQTREIHEVIDDQIDVVSRGLLGLTVGCARCHDHKYDPIPTRDYYSMYGIFQNTVEPEELPLIGGKREATALDSYYAGRLAAARQQLLEYKRERLKVLVEEFRAPASVEAYLRAARDSQKMSNVEIERLVRERSLNLYQLRRWRDYVASRPDATAGSARSDPAAPLDVPLSDFEKIMTEGDSNNTRDIRQRFERFRSEYAWRGAAPRAVAVQDAATIEPAYVFVRGNFNNLGAEAPRQFLSVLSSDAPAPFAQGSGRLELALAIASPDNPLTARVFVNRVWGHLFGSPLVRTPSDFGLRGGRPTHPALLDSLAVSFMNSGWSIKRLIREIVLSDAYRMSSADNPAARAIDPENFLLWRANRRRLDFEALRDSMLAVSGMLDTTMGGLPVSITSQPSTRRRTVYAFLDRGDIPPVLANFDVPNPEAHAPQRLYTTVPQQALYLMNSSFIAEVSRALASRREVASIPAAKFDQRIEALYRIVYRRLPAADEVALGRQFLARRIETGAEPVESPWRYGIGRYDSARNRTVAFTPFRYFSGDAWQNAPALPDVEAGNAQLTASGGQAGHDAVHATVRRWISPVDGVIRITGTVKHTLDKFKNGDGILARIVSSRSGQCGEWTVVGSEVKAECALAAEAGDTIDFIVEARQTPEADRFSWQPAIELAGPRMEPKKWDAAEDFQGPIPRALNEWERYAQALLQSNEFAFVD